MDAKYCYVWSRSCMGGKLLRRLRFQMLCLSMNWLSLIYAICFEHIHLYCSLKRQAVRRGTTARFLNPISKNQIQNACWADAEMEQLYLMPGEERYTKFQDENGVPKVRYTYCSLHGRLFNCTCKTMDEAQRLCEDWLVTQDRCYIN